MSASSYLENKILESVLRRQTYVGTDVYIALFITDPTDANIGQEVNAKEYARQKVLFEPVIDGTTSNTTDIYFPVAESTWGRVSHFGLFNGLTGGNLLFHGQFDMPKDMYMLDQFKIPQNYLVVKIK